MMMNIEQQKDIGFLLAAAVYKALLGATEHVAHLNTVKFVITKRVDTRQN